MGCVISQPGDVKVEFPAPPRPAEEVELEEAREAIRRRAADAEVEAERAAVRERRLKDKAVAAAKRASQSALQAHRARETLRKLDDPDFDPLSVNIDEESEESNVNDNSSGEDFDSGVLESPGRKNVRQLTHTFEDNVIPKSISFQYYSTTGDDTSESSLVPFEFKSNSVLEVARMFEDMNAPLKLPKPRQTRHKSQAYQKIAQLQSHPSSPRQTTVHEVEKVTEFPPQDQESPPRQTTVHAVEKMTAPPPAPKQTRSLQSPLESTRMKPQPQQNVPKQPSVSDYAHMFDPLQQHDQDLDDEPQEKVRKLPSVRLAATGWKKPRRRLTTFCFGRPEPDIRLPQGFFTSSMHEAARSPLRALQSD